jgi:succinyl-diaminopimelate desuccinylase
MDPWSGKEASGALYGRGTADMKSGVAALVIALARSAAAWDEERGVLLILTAGEETGCVGAKHVAKTQRPSMGGPMLVAEPTGLSLACGHKGVLWIRATAHGRSAHGSRPDLGQNAITALARAVTRLEDCGLPGTHPDMGDVTVNVGTFIGGTQINLVPDVAKAEIDVRFVPGIEPSALRDQIARIAGKAVAVEIMDTLPPVYTAPGGPLYSMLVSAVREVIGTVSVRQPLTYFTDASILSSSLRAPETLFFGPGDPDSAHVVDESCPIAEIEAAELVYERLLQAWRSAPQTGLLDDR